MKIIIECILISSYCLLFKICLPIVINLFVMFFVVLFAVLFAVLFTVLFAVLFAVLFSVLLILISCILLLCFVFTIGILLAVTGKVAKTEDTLGTIFVFVTLF